jgi:hypothetical protein
MSRALAVQTLWWTAVALWLAFLALRQPVGRWRGELRTARSYRPQHSTARLDGWLYVRHNRVFWLLRYAGIER